MLPPGDRYEELVLSFPCRGSNPHSNLPFFPVTISPSFARNRPCLSHETSNFSFLYFTQKPLKSLPLTSPILVPKPISIEADEHKGSCRGSPSCSTEQKSHLLQSEIGTKCIAINLGSLEGAQKFSSESLQKLS